MAEQINIRMLSLESLMEITENKKHSHLIEKQVLDKYAYLDKRDRAFYTALTEGTLQWMLRLDYVIDHFAKTPVRKQKPLIRNLLRMSVYQILFMDHVPDSAAINEAVKLAKKRGFTQLSGFVNGVLRTVSREGAALELPGEKDNLPLTLSVRYSMPEWIVSHFLKEEGEAKTGEILEAFQRDYGISARVNSAHATREELMAKLTERGMTVSAIPDTDMGIRITGYDSLSRIPEFGQGDFYVQDASSMMVAQWAGVREGAYCMDVCAAPGGKTLHLSELLKGSGHVEARDLTEYKVGLILENIKRAGAKNVSAKVWDASAFDETAVKKADLVICDAPCSGLGVIGRKKDIRYNASEKGIEELALLQGRILSTVSAYVKPGGTLMYSTCTISRAENGDNVRAFLDGHRDFKLDFMRQLYPGEIGCDGFFIARMIRKEKE